MILEKEGSYIPSDAVDINASELDLKWETTLIYHMHIYSFLN